MITRRLILSNFRRRENVIGNSVFCFLIPSRNRPEKLKRVLQSIEKQNFDLNMIHVAVVFDGDMESFKDSKNWEFEMPVEYQYTSHVGSIMARNDYVSEMDKNWNYINITDDSILIGNWPRMLRIYQRTYPDNSGVFGIAQNNNHSPTGVFVMGAGFLDRYDKRKPYYPGYYHFGAQEVHWLAVKVNKFVLYNEILIDHLHPMHNRNVPADRTHYDARVFKQDDMKLKEQRLKTNMIWGAD